jgi:hypothetical protein
MCDPADIECIEEYTKYVFRQVCTLALILLVLVLVVCSYCTFKLGSRKYKNYKLA